MGMEEHDIVVIGASAGGVDPLKEVDTSLSSDLRVRFLLCFISSLSGQSGKATGTGGCLGSAWSRDGSTARGLTVSTMSSKKL